MRVLANAGIAWNGVEVTREEFTRRLAIEAKKAPQPVVELDTDPKASYAEVVAVMKELQGAGMTKLGILGGS